MLLAGLSTGAGHALDFRTGLGPDQLQGLVGFELAYGMRWRMQAQDSALIGVGQGGTGNSGNIDNGNLNYNKSRLVSNMVRATGDLTLMWHNFGVFARGYAFYDFENERNPRVRTPLSVSARDQVGTSVEFLDAYLSARFTVNRMPLQFRLGKQVVNWGESRFFPAYGVNVANPLNVALFQQPTARPRDARLPVGMLWGSLQFNTLFAVEAYYQYEWQKTVLAAEGTFLSSSDTLSPGGKYILSGPFSDQGTNVDATLGLPPGTVGFDPNWFRVPRTSADRPREQGQFGLSLLMLAPWMNDTKMVLHFANYHSKVSTLGLITPSTKAYLGYSKQAIAAQTENLIRAGVDPDTAGGAASLIQTSQFMNSAHYFDHYSENIQMIGFSFNATSLRTGTAFFGEFSHHSGAPMPIATSQVFDQVLPGSVPGNKADILPPLDLEQISAEEITANFANKHVLFVERLDKSFQAVGATQQFGPQLGASQSLITAEIGWLHIWNFPDRDELLIAAPGSGFTMGPSENYADANSWGYRLAGGLTYNNVFGSISLRPRIRFTHDVSGKSPSGAGSFLEGRKSFGLGLGASYIQSLQANISYTTFWGAGRFNAISDRDYLNFNILYEF